MNKYVKIAIGAGAGAVLGYAYYYYIGCNSGTCAITSNWHNSMLYGAVMGVLLAYPGKKKANDYEKDESKNQERYKH